MWPFLKYLHRVTSSKSFPLQHHGNSLTSLTSFKTTWQLSYFAWRSVSSLRLVDVKLPAEPLFPASNLLEPHAFWTATAECPRVETKCHVFAKGHRWLCLMCLTEHLQGFRAFNCWKLEKVRRVTAGFSKEEIFCHAWRRLEAAVKQKLKIARNFWRTLLQLLLILNDFPYTPHLGAFQAESTDFCRSEKQESQFVFY